MFSTIAALSLSVASSVSLVIVNKYLISTLMFPYGALAAARAASAWRGLTAVGATLVCAPAQ